MTLPPGALIASDRANARSRKSGDREGSHDHSFDIDPASNSIGNSRRPKRARPGRRTWLFQRPGDRRWRRRHVLGRRSLGRRSRGRRSVGRCSLGRRSLGRRSVGRRSLRRCSLGRRSLRRCSLRRRSLGRGRTEQRGRSNGRRSSCQRRGGRFERRFFWGQQRRSRRGQRRIQSVPDQRRCVQDPSARGFHHLGHPIRRGLPRPALQQGRRGGPKDHLHRLAQ